MVIVPHQYSNHRLPLPPPPPQSFVRDMAHKQAVSPITSAPCDLDGMQQPSMKDGGDNWVEYIVQANDFSAYGIEASVLNCAISRCDASGGMSTSIRTNYIIFSVAKYLH